MATQHPDNARAPYWERDGDGFVSTKEEVAECFSAYRDLGCEEFMWDWEGKYVDEAVLDRLFHGFHDFFRRHRLGRDIFLTFRIPNIWQERGYTLARAMMGIITADHHARDLNFHTPPLFEVILPFADSAEKIMYIQKIFTELARFKNELFEEDSDFHYINVLPLFEGIDDLFSCRKILEKYLLLHKKTYKRNPPYLRPHIARSDPALNSGLVAAVVAGKIALSEMHSFGREHRISVFPAIGAGSLPFRGGLSPDRVKLFLKEYGGVRTAYIQSAFRYDYPLSEVKKSIAFVNAHLPKTEAQIFLPREREEARKICEIFSRPYRKIVESLAHTIHRLSLEVPSRRERRLHVGLFGYSRSVGKKKLPRAIPFTAILYSLGVPPEFIGTGRGLQGVLQQGIRIDKYYRNFREDIVFAGRYLNRENLIKLSGQKNGWKSILEDVKILEKFLGVKFGPLRESEKKHYTLTSAAFKAAAQKRTLTPYIIESGILRKSLG